MYRTVRNLALALMTLALAAGCAGLGQKDKMTLEDGKIILRVTPASGLSISLKTGTGELQLATGEQPAFELVGAGGDTIPFRVTGSERIEAPAEGNLGAGKGLRLSLAAQSAPALSGVTLKADLCLYESIPGVVIGRVDGAGLGAEALKAVGGTRFYALTARADLAQPGAAPYDFHLFQGAGYQWGKWYTKIKLTANYNAPNWTVCHLPEQQEGGGYPFNYLWTRNGGLALAHIDTLQRVAALPVKTLTDGEVALAIEQPTEFLHPDENGHLAGLPVMIGVFEGDYFAPLRAWGRLLQRDGFRFAEVPEASYEPIWCSWGFGRDVLRDDIFRNLPVVKKLGIPWVVMDDGYQVSVGEWPLRKEKFPQGDADMRALVDSIHAAGLKAMLWWVPMNVQTTDPLMAAHPDWVVLDRQGQPKHEKYWDVSQLCPAYPPVIEQQRGLVRRFLKDWDYDGFKMDGGCLGMVPPCYNPAHHHQRPEESCEAVATLFRAIQEEAESIKPGCVLEVCECGLPHNPYKMAYYNQEVTADPVSSDQVRARIKGYRALLGDRAALFGDHVELATGPYRGQEVEESGHDFASTLALGGVIGSKFTELVLEGVKSDWRQYKGTRPYWEHWYSLYNNLQLYKAEYLNLYDIANDLPETHVVARADTLYYGIFAPAGGFSGSVQLHGLKAGMRYALTDYADDNRPLGEVAGGEAAALECKLEEHLLVRAVPIP